jgi:hypothetical protein
VAVSQNEIYGEVCFARSIFTKTHNYIAVRFPEALKKEQQHGARFSQEGLSPETVRYQANQTFPGYFANDQLYHHAIDPDEQINLADDATQANMLQMLQKKLSKQLESFPFAFGELRPPANTTDPEKLFPKGWHCRRGETNPIFIYQEYNYLHFGEPEDGKDCPLGACSQPPTRNDAVLYASEERCAEGVAQCIPDLTLQHCGEDKLALTIAIRQPNPAPSWRGRIEFIDIYTNGHWIRRVPTSEIANGNPTITLESASQIRVVVYSPSYGWFTRELYTDAPSPHETPLGITA